MGAGSQTLSLLSESFHYIRLTDLARVPEAGVCCDDLRTCVHVRARRGAPTSLSCTGACEAATCMLHYLMSSHALRTPMCQVCARRDCCIRIFIQKYFAYIVFFLDTTSLWNSFL